MSQTIQARLSFWVITPERDAAETVAALRTSWLAEAAEGSVHYCVAAADDSDASGAPVHLLPVRRTRAVPPDRKAFELLPDDDAYKIREKEAYNSFLRRKVHAMLVAMAAGAARYDFDYAFLLDYDTAVNVTNLQQFANALPGGGDAPIFTGRCIQRGLNQPGGGRKWVARYMRALAANDTVGARGIAEMMPPSPGGGPGLLFSRGLLRLVQPQLGACAALAEPFAMGPGKFGGGDSMTTRCLASLGVRCSNDDDLNLAGERCPMAHGCALERLFRKNPPWLYRALRRTLANASAIRRKKLRRMIDEEALLPDDAAVSFHHVPPTRRARAMDTDPRCAIRLVSRESRAVGWWLSSCLPYLFVAGAPKAGTSSLWRYLAQHPDVVPPERKELRFFTPVTDAARHAGAAVGELLSRYANLFPSIHPRDFQVTGEASPAYVYSAAALRFFAQPNLKLARVVLLLREPAERTASEHRDKSDQPRGRRWTGDAPLRTTAAAAHGALLRCGAPALYTACAACAAFGGAAGAAGAAGGAACNGSALEVPPVLWQSWYHLFLPRWIETLRGRVAVAFSDELFGDAAALLARLGAFLQLPPRAYNTSLAYNTALRRGLAGDAAVPAAAAREEHERRAAQAAAGRPLLLRLHELTAHSVVETDALLRRDHRAGVPAGWLRRAAEAEARTAKARGSYRVP